MNAIRKRLSALRLPKGKARANTWLRALSAAVLFGLCLMLGYLLFFPAEALRQRLETEVATRTQTDFTVRSLHLGLPLSLQLGDVRLQGGRNRLPELRLDSLTVSPGWLSLVTGDPGVVVKGALYGGEMDLALSRSGSLEGEILDLKLEKLPALHQIDLPLALSGLLDAEVAAPTSPLQPKTVTRLELRLRQAALTGLGSLGISGDRVVIGDVLAQGELQGRKLSLGVLKASGGDLEIDAEGDLLLGASAARSRLNLQVGLRPGAGLDPTLKDLLSLTGVKQAGDGSYRFRLSGTLARPVLR